MNPSGWALTTLTIGLVMAVFSDLSIRRIPNVVTFGMVIVALALHTWFGQWEGLLFSLGGLLIGLLCFLPLYAFAAMGAGDVKLLTAVGAVVGAKVVFIAALMTIIAGGLLALVYVAAKGGLPAMLKRYVSMCWLLLARQPTYIPPAPGEAAGLRFPYALAIACGTALALI
ncbi:A24 family peptidase [Marinobacter orientalis]|uniref:Prepilin peptidase n=1 Tax=Marinobacter orientalis TaxID=1928859 RepID=A0A7Y0RBC2_9GAMM|nr:prepilin peptidase [Marinobacter orientalis]NMT63090.1 prepilin peptidase [Marinobacter orientalis]TGX51750.1 prepilin peptidase [Marinobacter orientalis]